MLTESINCDYYSIFHIINKKYLKSMYFNTICNTQFKKNKLSNKINLIKL